MRLKSVIANTLTLLLSTIVSVVLVLGAGELYFRMRTKADPRFAPWQAFHPERGWAPQPGEYTHFDFNESRESRVSINDLGLRDSALTLAVPPGKRRVSILGDSFVFAAALDEPETMVGQLRARLGNGYETVNMGVESYGTGQEALLAEELVGRGYVLGDAIVVVFFANDVMDNTGLELGITGPRPERPAFTVDSTGVLRHTKPVPPAWNLWQHKVARRSMFLVYLKSRATNLATANPWMLSLAGRFGLHPKLPRTPGVIEGFYGEGWQSRWERTRDILAYLSRFARQRPGTQFYVAYLPSPFQVVEALQQVAHRQSGADSSYAAFLGDIDRPQRLLRDFCARDGIPFIDTTPPLRLASRKESPFFLYESHLNPLGSQVAAEAIQKGLNLPAPR